MSYAMVYLRPLTNEEPLTIKTTPNTRETYGAGDVVRYSGRCSWCRKTVTALTLKRWQRAVSLPRPYCRRTGR